MTYNLSADDLAIVQATTEKVSDDQRPRIVAIHERYIATDKEHLAGLLREVAAVERAIAMRQASLAALAQPQPVAS